MKTPQETFEREKRLSEYAGDDRVVGSADIRKEIAATPPNTVRAMAKMPLVDTLIEGFEGGELIVISGPTKHGKTTFAQTLTRSFAEQNVHSLWFSFEVQISQLLKKYPEAHEFYLPRRLKDRDLNWLEDRIVESIVKYGVKAVFIDHLHYLVDMERSKSPSIEIGTIIRRLKLISIEHNVIIFLMAHMNKAKFEDMPTEGDVRDSSFIPQEADSTFMIWRERKRNKNLPEYTGRTLLNIANHRRTGVMGKIIPLMFNDGYLREIDGAHEIDMSGMPETKLDL